MSLIIAGPLETNDCLELLQLANDGSLLSRAGNMQSRMALLHATSCCSTAQRDGSLEPAKRAVE